MAEMNIALVKGDKIEGVEYRDALPVNTITDIHPAYGVAGYMSSHPGLTRYSQSLGSDRGGVYNERIKQHLRVSGGTLIRSTYTHDNELGQPKGVQEFLDFISGEDSQYYSQAVFPYSFNTQGIITDEKFWQWDGSDLVQITDPDLGGPIDGIWIDGYYLMTDGEYLFHTNIADETQIDPDNYATSEFSPDPTLAILKTQDNQAMVLNRYTTEYFYNAGIPDAFAFQRVPGKAVNVGVVGTHMKCILGGTVFIVGGSKSENITVMMVGPGQFQSVATSEIDKILGEYQEDEVRANGTMEIRQDDRDQLVYIRLPRHTLCYNHSVASAMGKEFAWSIIKSGVETDDPWTAINGVFDPVANAWIYGDRYETKLAALSPLYSAQYSEVAESIFYSPFIDLETGSIDSLEIRTIPGASLGDVNVFISLSYDGRTFGREAAMQYGTPLDYSTRFIARRLGYVRDDFRLKFRVVSLNRVSFCDLKIEYS